MFARFRAAKLALAVALPLAVAGVAYASTAALPDEGGTGSAEVFAGGAVALHAEVLNPDQVRIAWTSDDDVTGWNVARDGDDDFGPGTWDTDLGPGLRTWTFNSLIAGEPYTFTLTPLTAAGPGRPVTVTATPGESAEPVEAADTVESAEPHEAAKAPATAPAEAPAAAPAVAPGDGATAAARLRWGTPLPASDEFDYTGPPDPERWDTMDGCGEGHAGNGRRCADRSTVAGGVLTQTGEADGDSAWLGNRLDQRYGRWEARVRSFPTGEGEHDYHPLLIVWPESDAWPEDGEYDFLENGAPGEPCAEAFLHYPHPEGPVQQEHVEADDCGAPLSAWHNLAFEWTPDHVAGFLDGEEWFRFADGAGPGGRAAMQAMPGGHLTIQLDNFHGDGMRPAAYQVDWVRIYAAG